MGTDSLTRRLWTLFEPIHAVTYFAPECRAAFESAGLRGFWRGYFAGRAAPLGPVGPGPVYAAFMNFAPSMVERAVPDVWSRATPEQALAARRAGARAALAGQLSEVDHAAATLREAACRVDVSGRVLSAANAALPWPDEPLDVLWQAATTLREHRGDGHVAALVAVGLSGAEVLVWRTSLDDSYPRERVQPSRGWTDDEWSAAADRLTAKGWLDGSGSATAVAREAYASVEATTDRLAAQPWEGLDVERAIAILEPLSTRVAGLLPYPNPIGLPDPRIAVAST